MKYNQINQRSVFVLDSPIFDDAFDSLFHVLSIENFTVELVPNIVMKLSEYRGYHVFFW